MKTININLIGGLSKVSKKTKKQTLNKGSDIDPKIKVISMSAIIAACVIFAISFSTWYVVLSITGKTDSKLTKLKAEHEKLKIELANSQISNKTLQEEKKILETKVLAQGFIKDESFPWHDILVDVANVVPKELVIKKISKLSNANSVTTPRIELSGVITKTAGIDPLKMVSYFIVNINDNPLVGSLLSGATVKTFAKRKNSEKYDFAVESNVNMTENKQKKEKQPSQTELPNSPEPKQVKK